MRIVGIDPGIATTGFGVVEHDGRRMTAVDYGCILTDKHDDVPTRLFQLHQHLGALLATHQPDLVAVEKLFFNTNVTTAIVVGQARGIVLLCAKEAGCPIAEYTPGQVKAAVCGYGAAKKPQVQAMVQSLLRLTELPKPDDAADGLALAVCHAAAHRSAAGVASLKVAA